MENCKKRRLQGACDSCRTRKKACDSAQRPGAKCSNCVTFNLECTHIATMSRKNGGIPLNSASWETTEDLQVHITAILQPTYAGPKDNRVTRPLLVQLARYIRQLEAKISSLENPGGDSPPVEDPMSKLSISETKNRHYGAEDDTKFIKSAIDLKETLDPTHSLRRPLYWTLPYWQYVPTFLQPPLIFPPPDLLDSLVTLFLETTNTQICLLHGPSFRRDIANGIHCTSREFGSVVLAVCAVAARASTDPRVGDGHSAGWQWYSQLHPLDPVNYVSPGCLWDLQLLTLMVCYLYALSVADQCWLYIGMGIRLAQDMGIHRKRRRRTNEPWTPHDEALNRAWWVLILHDVYASAMFGRVRTTNSDEFDSDFPLLVDDEYWPGELLADPIEPWTQPPDIPAQVTAWVLHLKLLEIYGFAQKTIYSVKRSDFWDALSTAKWGHNVAVELDSALNKWIDAIPDHLRWDPHRPSEASAVLYTTYYWVQIQIHRPFITNADRWFSSIAVCTNAARSCAHVLHTHYTAFERIPLCNMLATTLYSAIVLLLITANSYGDGAIASSRDLEDVYKMMEVLRRHEGRWQMAGRYHDVIAEVFALLQAPKPQQDSRKRKGQDTERDWGDLGLDMNFVSSSHGPEDTMTWEGWSASAWEDFGVYLAGVDDGRPF